MTAASLLVGGIALYEEIDFRLHGKPAMMELANPGKKIVLPVGDFLAHTIDVRYVSAEAVIVVQRKLLSGEVARKLVAGSKVPVTYYSNDLQRVVYATGERSNPWGWLCMGAVLLITFIFSLKLLRRE